MHTAKTGKQITRLIQQNNIKDFIINVGGDIFAQGQKHSKNWRIAIENPFYTDKSSDRIIGQIQLSEPMSIFTSGNYRRFYKKCPQLLRKHLYRNML